MKTLFLFFIALTISETSRSSPNCRKIPNIRKNSGNLTATWFLDYIGADFAKKFVGKGSRTKIDVGMLDNSLPQGRHLGCYCPQGHGQTLRVFDQYTKSIHGHLVSQFFVGPRGSTEQVKSFHSFIHSEFQVEGHNENENNLTYNSNKSGEIKVLNISMDRADPKSINESELLMFSRLDAQGVILVRASGNEAQAHPSLSEQTQRVPGIIVGGMTSDAKLWEGGKIGDRVIILAPAQHLLAERSDQEFIIRSGTSLATPLVSGSIVNALSVFPSLTRNNIELLIQKTGVPLPLTAAGNLEKKPSKMINSYKMVRVAERLKKEMEGKKFTSLIQRERQITNLIQSPEILDFSKESMSLIESAEEQSKSQDCSSKWEALDLYREAFLLSGSEEARDHLERLYFELSYSLNAQFYRNLKPTD